MKADFANLFTLSLLGVLSAAAQLELRPEAARGEPRVGDLSGLVGMVGPQLRGSLSISFERGLAIEIVRRMRGEVTTAPDEALAETVGEITGMVAAGARRMLGGKGYEFDMASPAVVSGPGHHIRHRATGARILLSFDSDYGRVTLEICVE